LFFVFFLPRSFAFPSRIVLSDLPLSSSSALTGVRCGKEKRAEPTVDGTFIFGDTESLQTTLTLTYSDNSGSTIQTRITAPVTQGRYRSDGFHTSVNANYFTGRSNGLLIRSFFLYTIPNNGKTVTSATVSLPLGTSGNGQGLTSAFFILRLFGGNQADLLATNNGLSGVTIFQQLAQGTVMGFTPFTPGSPPITVVVTLNSQALAELNALTTGAGGNIAFGGVYDDSAPSPSPTE
jgi:hypothetical protein